MLDEKGAIRFAIAPYELRSKRNEPHARGRRVGLTGLLGVWGVPSTRYVVRPWKHAK